MGNVNQYAMAGADDHPTNAHNVPTYCHSSCGGNSLSGASDRPFDIGDAVLHVRVKELLRVIQTENMEGVSTLLRGRTWAVRWCGTPRDESGLPSDGTHEYIVFPELIIGMEASKSVELVARMEEALQSCLKGLDRERGVCLLDAIHEGFILDDMRLIFDVLHVLSALEYTFRETMSAAQHLMYAVERALRVCSAYNERLGMYCCAEYMVASLDRRYGQLSPNALWRSVRVDSGMLPLRHTLTCMMRAISNHTWRAISPPMVRAHPMWHFICHHVRQTTPNLVNDFSDTIYILPYATAHIFNKNETVERDDDEREAKPPHCIRMVGKANGGVVTADVLDWWCVVSWSYMKRVFSVSASEEAVSKCVQFPDHFTMFGHALLDMTRTMSTPEIHFPAGMFTGCSQDDSFLRQVEEFELTPFVIPVRDAMNLVSQSKTFQSVLFAYCGEEHGSHTIRTGFDSYEGLHLSQCSAEQALTIIQELDAALSPVSHPNDDTVDEFAVKGYRYLRQMMTIFKLTRSLDSGLSLHTAVCWFLKQVTLAATEKEQHTPSVIIDAM